jgi:hypothetical protein
MSFGAKKAGGPPGVRDCLNHAVACAVQVAKCRARVAWVRPGPVSETSA